MGNFAEYRLDAFEAHGLGEMFVEARAHVLMFAAIDSTPEDGRRVEELEQKIVASYQRLAKERGR